MKIWDVIKENSSSRYYHEILADRVPAGLQHPAEIVSHAFEIAAMKMGPSRARRLFAETPGFEQDLISAYMARVMPRVQKLSENWEENTAAAKELAVQIRDAMDEHYSLAKSGRKDPDTLRQLDQVRKSLVVMNKEMHELGFKFAPTSRGMIAVKGAKYVEENLRKWFREKWVRFGPDGKIRGSCARGSEKEGKPKCLPQAKAHALGKKGRASAARRKRREDPNPNRRGAAINVATKKK